MLIGDKMPTVVERASVSLKNNTQLLSSKKFNCTMSLSMINPFHTSQKFDVKNKIQTSLELYSKSISNVNKEASSHHQRNWSGIKSDDTANANISLTAISARSNPKNPINQKVKDLLK